MSIKNTIYQKNAERVERAIRRGTLYYSSISWLVSNGLLSRQRYFWAVISLSLASIFAQSLAVAFIFVYVRTYEKDTPFLGLATLTDWMHSTWGLLLFIIAFCTLLSIHQIATYKIKVLAVRLMCDVEAHLGRRCANFAQRLPDLALRDVSKQATENELRFMFARNVRYCALAVRLMVLALPAIVALTAAFVGMLILDPLMSGLLIVAGAGVFLFQYPANVQGADATRQWQAARPPATKLIARAVRSFRNGSLKKLDDAEVFAGDLYRAPIVEKSIVTYGDRLRAIETGSLVTQLGTTALIGIVILIIGERALNGSVDWAFLISYVSLLRLASGHFSSVARNTTSLARLYPQVRDFVAFMASTKKQDVIDALKRTNWFLGIHSSDKNNAFGHREVTLERRDIAALISVQPFKEAQPEFAIVFSSQVGAESDALGKQEENQSSISGMELGTHETSKGPIVKIKRGRLNSSTLAKDVMGLPSTITDADWNLAVDKLRRSGIISKSETVSLEDLEKFRRSWGENETIDRQEIVAQLAAALVRRASVIIIEQEALNFLGCKNESHQLFDILKSQALVFTWYPITQIRDGSAFNFGEDMIVVCDAEAVLNVFDLRDSNGREDLNQCLALKDPANKSRSKESTALDFDDSLLDM